MRSWIPLAASCRHILGAGIVLIVFASPPVFAAAQDKLTLDKPTLADLARQEQERRKAVKVSGKVFTDKGAKPASPRPAPPADQTARPAATDPAQAAPPQSGEAPAGAAADEQKAEPVAGKGETWWKGRITQAREELRRSEMFAEALQTRVNALTGDFVARDDPYQRSKIGEDRQKAVVEMDRVKADIERLKKQIAEIEEEARMAGAPPGWLR